MGTPLPRTSSMLALRGTRCLVLIRSNTRSANHVVHKQNARNFFAASPFQASDSFPPRQNSVPFATSKSKQAMKRKPSSPPPQDEGPEGFPPRMDSQKKVDGGNYGELVKDFGTYGRFVNHCVEEKVKTKTHQRQAVLKASLVSEETEVYSNTDGQT